MKNRLRCFALLLLISQMDYGWMSNGLHNFEKIDVSAAQQILSASQAILVVTIINNSLTLTGNHPRESLQFLHVTDCTLDDSFKQNAWKVMPNLTEFALSYSNLTNVDLSEISPFKQLKNLHVGNANLTFQNPTQEFNTVKTLEVVNSRFDEVEFIEVIRAGFPNLTRLNIDTGRNKVTEGFLMNALNKLPEIQHILLNPFDLITTSQVNGTFEVSYVDEHASSNLINSNADNAEMNHCIGEFKNGKLKLTWKTRCDSNNISETCSNIEIRVKNVTEIDWTEIERISLPKLKYFILNFTTDDLNFTAVSYFDWIKMLSLVSGGSSVIESKIYVNNDEVFSYEFYEQHVSISRIDPYPILSAVSDMNLQLGILSINDVNLGDIVPIEVGILRLNKVHLGNFSATIQKFKILRDLSLDNYELIDIQVILQILPKLENLAISNVKLTCNNTDTTVKSESLKRLELINCVQDVSFRENGWKVMPSLKYLEISSTKDKVEIKLADFLDYKKLESITIKNGSLRFTKSNKTHSQFNALSHLRLTNCEFENNFENIIGRYFPKLEYLGVDADLGWTKPTREFLTGILDKIPHIRVMTLNNFKGFQNGAKGIFNITWYIAYTMPAMYLPRWYKLPE